MPMMFNSVLREGGLSPDDVRLIRHKDTRASRGRTPYDLWCNDRHAFEIYQSLQSVTNKKKLIAPYWAVFVVNFAEEPMFAVIYSVVHLGDLTEDVSKPHMDGVDKAGSCHRYSLELQDAQSDLIGRLFIDWGPGALAWVQYANRNDKLVTELWLKFQEPEFPGYLNFIKPLSGLDSLPQSWISALRASRGVYLLTCPRTKEQYVGSATGDDGFWGRWQNYITTGHGGNVALKSRDPSDYQVSILEVAGTSSTNDDVRLMEGRWQLKLQSQEMGLNRNQAHKV